MDFSIARAQMLELLADSMEVPEDRRSALLGRFQHLQRLSLIEGINPGRGKAAEYGSHHVLIIAVAFQMLQLGLTPERAVRVLKLNQDRLRLAIGLAVANEGTVSPSMVWFDPAILSGSSAEGPDWSDATFNYGGQGTGLDAFRYFFVDGWVQRSAFISVSGTLWHIIGAMEQNWPYKERPEIGPTSRRYLQSLRAWYGNSKPDSLA